MGRLSRWTRRETTKIHQSIATHAEDNTRERGIRRDWATHSIEWWDGDKRGYVDADAIEDLAVELLWDGRSEITLEFAHWIGGPVPGVPAWAMGAFYQRLRPCDCAGGAHLRDCYTARMQRAEDAERALAAAELAKAEEESGRVRIQIEGWSHIVESLPKEISSKEWRRRTMAVPVPPEDAHPPHATAPLAPAGKTVIVLGSDFAALSDAEQRALMREELKTAPTAETPPRTLAEAEERLAAILRLSAARLMEAAAPSAVASAPAVDRSGPRVFCQSQYDPDD